MKKSSARSFGVGLVVLLLAAAVALGLALHRRPEQFITVRLTRTGAVTRSPTPTTARATYIAGSGIAGVTRPFFEGPRSPPVTWTTALAVRAEHDDLVVMVPLVQRSVRDELLREVQLDGVTFTFSDQGEIVPDASGTAVVASHGEDLPDFLGFDTAGLTEARVVLDDAPLVRVDLVIPPDLPLRVEDDEDDEDEPPEGDVALSPRPEIERLETEPGAIPHITMRTGAQLGIAIGVSPAATPRDCLRAAMVSDGDFRHAFFLREYSHSDHDLDVPLTVTRTEWEQLLAADVSGRGFYGGTPTLTLDPRGSIWFHAPPGDLSGSVELTELFVVVGCLGDRDTTRIGVVEISIHDRYAP